MKLAGYVRVSTDAQAERGFGLDVQEDVIRQWASGAGHAVALLCGDEGISGTKDASERPGLTDALSAVCEGSVSGLVVARMDRLARSLTIQEACLAQVWRYGGLMFSADVGEIQADDPDDPMRTFVRQVMGAAAQLDRAATVARLRAGRQAKANGGGYAGYGPPPFGFCAEGGELVPLEDEQAALVRILELHRSGASLRSIGETLTSEGYQPKRADAWRPATLRRIIARAEGITLPPRRPPSWAKTA